MLHTGKQTHVQKPTYSEAGTFLIHLNKHHTQSKTQLTLSTIEFSPGLLQQQEEPVWLEGQKLCYKTSRADAGSGAPESLTAFCVCIDIGAKKSVDAPAQTRPRTYSVLSRLGDWKRMILFFVLMVLLVAVVLWPLQCVFTTGNMRCTREMYPPTTTPPTTNPTYRFIGTLN